MQTRKFTLRATAKGAIEKLRSFQYLPALIRGPVKKRDQARTRSGYETAWSVDLKKRRSSHFRLMVLDQRFAYSTTQELDHEFCFAQAEGIRRMLELRRASGSEGPCRVLEVGSGYGRTLAPLSFLFPTVEFYGIEYSDAGVAAFQEYQKNYRAEICGIASKLGTAGQNKDPVAVEFKQGDGKALPYPDEFFDFAYTNIVLEQIPLPADHRRIQKEMNRVSKFGCGFLEPWKEAQDPLTFAYLKYIDYFRASWRELAHSGFGKINYRTLPFHHNVKYKLGYAYAEKST